MIGLLKSLYFTIPKIKTTIKKSTLLCMVLSSFVMLQGCGPTLLDGSSQNKLQESAKKMKEEIENPKIRTKFDVGYNILNYRIANEVKQGLNENTQRMKYFDGKDAKAVIEEARDYEKGLVDVITERLKKWDNCYQSQKTGLKILNPILRSSSVKPTERIELSFELENSSIYQIKTIQSDIAIQVFGAPGMEKRYEGKDSVSCHSAKNIAPGTKGKMQCVLNYEMGSVRYEGPASDVQLFEFKIIDTDDTPLNDKDDETTMAYCKAQSSKLKSEIELYLNDLAMLNGVD